LRSRKVALYWAYYRKTRIDFQGAEQAIAEADEIEVVMGNSNPEALLKIITTPSVHLND
jgi:hypothetical protein